MFKVRNTGGCIQSGKCSSNCPVGIDVSYEINNYGKVTNTNCTSCMICIEGCPTSAVSYKWENPFKEKYRLKHYSLNRDMFTMGKIKDKFQSLHRRDYLLLPLTLLFGFAIDGLYGMGHFLSFGIAIIASAQVFVLKEKIQNTTLRLLLIGMILFVITWHGIIKFSIWQGLSCYENNDDESAIAYLERAIIMYPKPIGRFHMILARMYLRDGNIEVAKYHTKKAQKINPDHNGPVELLKEIDHY
jgi:NAD-dependent dihydropyrimidine dehydrogenase PreA subunit